MKYFEAANPNDPDDLTAERDANWFARCVCNEFGPYVISGVYDSDPADPFVVATPASMARK